MAQKLTNRLVQDMGPGDTIWDTAITGLGVRCQKRSKSFVYKYRIDGRQRFITIGRYGAITLEQARKQARALAGEVAIDRDPARTRDETKSIPSVREAAQRFLAEHVEAKRKPKTAYEYRRLMDRLILPAVGDIRIDRLARRDVAQLHDSLRDTPHQANRVLAVMSKLIGWCEARGLRPEAPSPTRHIEKYRENRRERFLSEMELAMLGDTLTDGEAGFLRQQAAFRGQPSTATPPPHPDAFQISPFVAAAVRLLIFSGARVGEILGLRWADIDQERGLIFLPNSKTGQKPLIITAPMAQVLESVPRLDANPHVIAGGKPGAHLVDLERPWRRLRDQTTLRIIRASEEPKIDRLLETMDRATGRRFSLAELREAAEFEEVTLPTGLSDVRLHDLRHTFASYAAGMGHSLPMIGRLLGHTQPATTARYAHLAHDPVQEAANATSARIANLLSAQQRGEDEQAEIKPLRRR